jgi:hypothetical protein
MDTYQDAYRKAEANLLRQKTHKENRIISAKMENSTTVLEEHKVRYYMPPA